MSSMKDLCSHGGGHKVILNFDEKNNVWWALLYNKTGDYIEQGVGSSFWSAIDVLASRVSVKK